MQIENLKFEAIGSPISNLIFKNSPDLSGLGLKWFTAKLARGLA
jgi:hypothetical protein